jgi:ribosomal protein S25
MVSEIKPVTDQLGITYNTAAKIVKALAELNILLLEQEQSRHKVYRHRAIDVFES